MAGLRSTGTSLSKSRGRCKTRTGCFNVTVAGSVAAMNSFVLGAVHANSDLRCVRKFWQRNRPASASKDAGQGSDPGIPKARAPGRILETGVPDALRKL